MPSRASTRTAGRSSSITFNTAGARRFGRVTQENVSKPFAIILDDKVLSAPNINEPILGGQAQISGSFTVESANQLAVSLASGKLPVKLNVIEERTVSAELGKDSIQKGTIACDRRDARGDRVHDHHLWPLRRLCDRSALIVNAFLILGIMAVFNATLTLPGIAGFVLTIGAAVDANVLINERIREELRRGRKILDAIETGYKEASTAIFDANITNVIAAALMCYFGSGPIRGFAVVLLIGIVTSVFTAVNFTRMLVALWVRRKRPRDSISEGQTMKLLKLVPDNTNIDFMKWRNIALILSIIATVASLALVGVYAASTSASTSSAARWSARPSPSRSISRICAARSTRSTSAKPASRNSATARPTRSACPSRKAARPPPTRS